MRKSILAGSLITLISAAVPAAAQSLPPDPGTWVLGIGAGATIPVGKQTDFLKTGFHGAVNIGYDLPNADMELGVEGIYLRAKNKLSNDNYSNVYTIMAHAHIGAGERGGPYLVLGAGVLRNEYKQALEVIDGPNEITNTHSAFAIEGGVGINFGKVVFLEGRVLHSFRKDDDEYTLVPITLGIRF
ncbi:MAG TPA: outer membrane beta-barrel protein [Gemmatimonadales bacterium]|jgi:hypothetical protein